VDSPAGCAGAMQAAGAWLFPARPCHLAISPCSVALLLLYLLTLQVITRTASQRIAEFAFKYAEEHGRKTVCAVHKATIMCVTDGCYRVSSGGCAS